MLVGRNFLLLSLLRLLTSPAADVADLFLKLFPTVQKSGQFCFIFSPPLLIEALFCLSPRLFSYLRYLWWCLAIQKGGRETQPAVRRSELIQWRRLLSHICMSMSLIWRIFFYNPIEDLTYAFNLGLLSSYAHDSEIFVFSRSSVWFPPMTSFYLSHSTCDAFTCIL